MATAIVKECTCTADKHGNTAAARHQDAVLGAKQRFHNPCGGAKAGGGARCTVCGTKR